MWHCAAAAGLHLPTPLSSWPNTLFEKELEKEPVQNLAKKLRTSQNFHLIIYKAEKSDAPKETPDEVPETKPAKNPGQVVALKKLPERNLVAHEAKILGNLQL